MLPFDIPTFGTMTWPHCIWQTALPRSAAALKSPESCTKGKSLCSLRTSTWTCPYALFRVTCFYVSYLFSCLCVLHTAKLLPNFVLFNVTYPRYRLSPRDRTDRYVFVICYN